MLKLERGEGGDAWHRYDWYDGEQLIAGAGEDPCVGCHEEVDDFVSTPWPQ